MNGKILAPGIVLYEAKKEEVDYVLSLIEPTLSSRWKPAMVVNTETYSNEIITARSCFNCGLTENNNDQALDLLYDSVNNLIQPKVDDFTNYYYVEKNKKGPYVFLKYQNNDKFDWHVDDGKKFPRTVSVSAYLNDDYEGGEFEFQHFGISHKPKAGDIIVFSSSFPYLHRVKPVISGTRYAIVNWYRYADYPEIFGE
jgi:2OG-Fe(II) oxygenase superfamily